MYGISGSCLMKRLASAPRLRSSEGEDQTQMSRTLTKQSRLGRRRLMRSASAHKPADRDPAVRCVYGEREGASVLRDGLGTAGGISSWTADELAAFLAAVASELLSAIWRLSAMTGMRRGEILGLRWTDIELDAARLSVRHAVVAVGYEMVESTPKSHRARVIDLDAGTVAQLRAHRQRQDEERAEWGADYEDRDLVVAKENGEPIHPHTFSQSFERLIAKAGLRPIRLHDLRHTHATLALKAGVPVKVISERLGHESPAFTLKQYAHVIPGMQAEAAAPVAAMIDGPPPSV
jgi:integrase